MEAAQEFFKAAQHKSEYYESILNSGVAYRKVWRNQTAKLFHRKAIQLKPKDPSSHIDLGTMLYLLGKLTEALKLRPLDQTTNNQYEMATLDHDG